MPSVSAHVAHALAAHVTEAFGVMGHGNAHLIDALAGCGVRYTALRHEAGAVVAADAYARTTGRLALATATFGAGFTNTLTALAEAVQAHTPLVLAVGDAPDAGPRPWDVDQEALAAAVGARTYRVRRHGAAGVTLAAVSHALEARTAVVLAIPADLVAVDAGPLPVLPELGRIEPQAADGAQIEAAAELLASARRPFVLVGRGAWLAGAGEELGRLAEALGAVTGSTALGRGVLPEEKYDVGVVGGFGAPRAMELVRQADVALVVGAGLNQFTTRFGELLAPDARVVRVDDRPVDPGTGPEDSLLVQGDARLVAGALAAALARREVAPSGWRESEGDLADGALLEREAGVGVCADGRLDPRSVASRLAEILPVDRVVVSDGGHFIGWANTYWPVTSPDRMVMVGTAFQSIGMGLPSAVGAGVGRPDATVVLTTGDGGALMALADLESAVRTVRRGVVVVWNDAAYGAEAHVYGPRGLDSAPMLIPEVDFAALARSVGALGTSVRTLADLDALAAWLSTGDDGVHLVDCRVSRSVVAPFQREIVDALERRR
ncbi:thiamine pyrophosphate protein central region [Beutenbergia cavernae DSM 12333]|uniref:Thiamine pyrophosphate protein central region n=1 Tax=Beutenbergia cavernae (strain ATCC BAA-8 / DSM 12333 / CCUG 43141 / JCM 11478 / NBRC 16432 / NCIMB 13614 / HKI 0122) TaxID=471853 RepID=C5BZG2_BEUC1|nr:thiamine pyrophosphate-binding protein [Beutenbergia cavernae]ACQ79134.1 thiamine pyrophosphate protein central region [Beutenbergia cavernae DSM 12333]